MRRTLSSGTGPMALLPDIGAHIGSVFTACFSTVWKCSVCARCFGSEAAVREHFASEHLFAPLDEFC